jgi:hypothetical protein
VGDYAGAGSGPGALEPVAWSSNVLTKPLSELVIKLRDGNLRLMDEMPLQIVQKLRDAVLASPVVDRKTKALLMLPRKGLCP